MEVISRLYNWHACPSEVQYLIVLQLRKTRSRLPSKMVQLASFLFILFCTVSPKLLLLNNNNNMDMEASPNISPMVPFKSTTLPTKTSSFSTKLSPLPIKPKLSIFEEALSVPSWIERVLPPQDPMGIILTIFLFFVLLLILVLHMHRCILEICDLLKKIRAGSGNQSSLPIQHNANYSKKTPVEEI